MRVLLVEDAPRLAQAVAEILRGERYLVDVASTRAQAEGLAVSGAYDMVLLDIMLPDGSGIDVLRGLRAAGDATPVILLTARDAVADRVAGLDAGADDYLPKPFHASELLARMRALLRRPREIVDDGLLATAGLVLDARSLIVRAQNGGVDVDDGPGAGDGVATGDAACGGSLGVELTPKEAALLEALMRAGGRVVAKDALAARVWGPYATGAGNRLEVLMHALREKIARTGAPAAIDTVRGAGYRLHEKWGGVMFGAKNTAYKTARVRMPGHLAKTRRNLILLSSALTCAILVICLAGAWGIAARTSRQGNIAAMSDVIANSLELTPQTLQGGAPTVDQALVQAQARHAASQDTGAQGSASYAAAIKSEDRTSPGLIAAWRPFVLLELADGTVKFAIAPQWGEPQEVIMSRDDAVGLVQGAIDAVHGRASGAPASHGATQAATHTAQAGPTTWLWSTYVLCVNTRGMGNPGGDVVSFYEDDDLSAYADEGLIAARAYVFVDQTPALTNLTSLAVALASVGAVGCVLLVLACRAVIGRALAPAAAAWEAQQRFVGRASHELKTPLASLTSALDVLDAHADQTVASQKRWLSNMREDVGQMAGMACTLLGALDPGVDVGAGAPARADADAGPGADPAGSATSSATPPATNGEEL